MGSSNNSEKGLIDARGVAIRAVLFILILALSNIAVLSYETRIIEPQADWEILVDSYELEIDFLDDIAFFNATEGWVIGRGDVGTDYEDRNNGIIMHTSNGGYDWEIMHSEQYLILDQIEIVDAETIWVATRWGLLHTEDRGLTWEYTSRVGDEYPYIATRATSVKFRNSSYGLASVGHEIQYTNDAGETWNSLPNWNYDTTLYEINFVGDAGIWACGYYGIYRGFNNGESWTQQRGIRAYSMSVLNELEAWALSYNLGVTHSTDGETWCEDMVVSERGFAIDFYYEMEFIDENNGWLVGTGSPSVAYTPDGGASWYAQMTSFPKSLKTLDFINLTHGWAAGWNGVIVKTENGNQFGARLIIDGLQFRFINTLVIPQSAIIISLALAVALPVLFLIERIIVFRNKTRKTTLIQ